MTINDQPDETTQPQEETSPSGDTMIADEAHQVAGSRGAPSAGEDQPAAAEAQEATSGPRVEYLVHREDEPLTCAVCSNPIDRNTAYLEAAYGPVHYTDCANRTKAL